MARKATRHAREPERDTKGLRDYLLPVEQTTELRQLIVGEAEPAELTAFWERMAAEHLFDLPSLVVDHVPEEGQARYKAKPVELFDKEDGQVRAATEGDELAGDAEIASSPDPEAQMAGSERRADEAVECFLDNLDSSTLAGDLAAGMLMAFQAIHKPWDQHSQAEKRERVAQLETLSVKIVRGLVELMAGGDRVSVSAMIDKIAIGEKVQIGLKLSAMPHHEQAEAITQLFDWKDSAVLIISADANPHLGRRGELVEPDQVEMPFDPGDPPAPEPEAEREAPPADDSDLAGDGDGDGEESDEDEQQDDELAGEFDSDEPEDD